MDILISEDLDSPAIHALGEKYQLLHGAELWKNSAKLKEALRGVRAIIVRNQTQLTAEVLAEAHHLLVIGRVGVGVDNIDIEAATEHGVVVIAPLNANATSVAELTFGLMLSLARKIPLANGSTRSGVWDRNAFTGVELDRKILAICGFGRIGRLVAKRARAFGMRIVVFDPLVASDSPQLGEIGATLATKLEAALEVADFVSVHLPLLEATHRLFDANAFAAMKPGAFFINTSRGPVMDEPALLRSLQEKHLGGAALDVRDVEPPECGELEKLENVILTPHIGAFTKEAQTRTFECVCEDLDRVLSGQSALHSINITEPSRLSKA